MKSLSIFLFIFLFSLLGLAARVGQLNVRDADMYSDADFDSDIIDNVRQNEKFLVSVKNYEGFYKVKLKSGKLGFIPDYQIVINGKGFEAKPYLDEDTEDAIQNKKKNSKKLSKEELELKKEEEQQNDEDDEPFDFNLHGVTLQLINFHEDTLGSVQVDDLIAVGYKHLADISYEVMAAFKAPKYYSEKTFGSAQGFNIWGTYGINNIVPITAAASLRYGGSVMAHYSKIKVTTNISSYDLQDLTAGVVLEGALLLHFKKTALDFSIKYFFDRNNYAGFGLLLLF